MLVPTYSGFFFSGHPTPKFLQTSASTVYVGLGQPGIMTVGFFFPHCRDPLKIQHQPEKDQGLGFCSFFFLVWFGFLFLRVTVLHSEHPPTGGSLACGNPRGGTEAFLVALSVHSRSEQPSVEEIVAGQAGR